MTQLRQKMLEELQRRNYSHRTAKTYVRIVREFAEHFHQSPDKLGPEQIWQYQAHLFQIELKDDQYAELVVQVEDPAAVVAQINQAIGAKA